VPAVDDDSLAGDEGCLVGREKGDGVRDVLGRAEVTCWNGREIGGSDTVRTSACRSTGMKPGATVLTVIPSGASSRAQARLSPIWAFLAAAYADRPGGGRWATSESICTIRPKWRSLIDGSTARSRSTGLRTK
jgi:hypothetical protein